MKHFEKAIDSMYYAAVYIIATPNVSQGLGQKKIYSPPPPGALFHNSCCVKILHRNLYSSK